VGMRGFAIGGVLTALVFAVVVSPFAATDPDGLERVAPASGFLDSARDHALGSGIFADYATAGIGNETLSLAVAGVVGVGITLAVGTGLFMAVRGPRRRSDRSPAADRGAA